MQPHITTTPNHVSIYLPTQDGTRSRGVASADLYHPRADELCWWISRVLVTDEADRGKGIGGVLLDLMLAEVVKQGGRVVIVGPGGYGADPKRQRQFYEAHDFAKVGEGSDVHWAWNADLPSCRKLAARAAEALARSLEG